MKRLLASEREAEAKRDADPDGYRIPYAALEMLSHLSYTLLAIIWGLSNVSYLKQLDVAWWYCWQVLVPALSVSTLFCLGRPLYEIYNIKHSLRPLLAWIWTAALSLSGIVVGVTFMIIKIVFVANSDPSDADSIRSSRVATFVVLMGFCAALVLVDVLLLFIVVKIWLRKPHTD